MTKGLLLCTYRCEYPHVRNPCFEHKLIRIYFEYDWNVFEVFSGGFDNPLFSNYCELGEDYIYWAY